MFSSGVCSISTDDGGNTNTHRHWKDKKYLELFGVACVCIDYSVLCIRNQLNLHEIYGRQMYEYVYIFVMLLTASNVYYEPGVIETQLKFAICELLANEVECNCKQKQPLL